MIDSNTKCLACKDLGWDIGPNPSWWSAGKLNPSSRVEKARIVMVEPGYAHVKARVKTGIEEIPLRDAMLMYDV
jgi:hypothetical protein